MPPFLDPLVESLRTTWSQVVQLSPTAFAVIVFLLVGWLLAQLARRLVIRLLRLVRLDVAAERGGVEDFLLRGGVRYTAVTLVGQFVYWVVLLVGVLAVFNLLDVPMSTTVFDQIAGYLPNVLAALLILVFGSMLARFVRGAVHTWLNNVGAQSGQIAGILAHVAILVFVTTLALEQLRIGGQVLVSAFQLAFGGLCLALALAFGLGGRDWASSLLNRAWKNR
ncbi:MAG: mechanosensitive ion channel family protein [Gemmatimonadales bacterium]